TIGIEPLVERDDAEDGGDRDDVAASLPDHVVQAQLRHLKIAGRVDGHGGLPVGARIALDMTGELADGVVNENVDDPSASDRRPMRLVDALLAGQIERQRKGLASAFD